MPSVLSVGATQDSVTDFVGGGAGGGVVEPLEPLLGGVVEPPEPLVLPAPLPLVGVDVVEPLVLLDVPPDGVVLVAVEVPPLDGAGVEVAELVPPLGLEPLLGQPASSTQAAPIRESCAKGNRWNRIMVGSGEPCL